MNDFFINAVMAQYFRNIGRLDAFDGIDIDAAVVGYPFSNDDAIVLDVDDISLLEYTFYGRNPDGKKTRPVVMMASRQPLSTTILPFALLPETSHRFLE